MKKTAIAIALAVIFSLAGCTTTNTVSGTTKNKYVVYSVSKSFLEPSAVEASVTPEDYVAMSSEERENYLIKRIGDLLTALRGANSDKASIVKELAAQEAKFKELNAGGAD